VARKKYADELSVDELRHLLIEKRRTARHERIEVFRRTGRVVVVAPEPAPYAPDQMRVEDEPPVGESVPADAGEAPRSKRKVYVDRFLLLVEVAAVLGFLFLLFNGVSLIRDLNHEVAAALLQPTLTPTPIIVAVVLPSGHTPPNAEGGAQPNEAEIPANLRPMVQALANLPVPTASPEQAVRIQISALGVDAPIVQGDGWDQLKKGVGQHVGTANPGLPGNLVLSAHNDVFGEIFRDLDRLKTGDTIVLYTNQRLYTYVVTGSQIVLPTQVEVMGTTQDPTVTLISCYPYMVDKKRIVITAKYQKNS
jgi:sortase A